MRQSIKTRLLSAAYRVTSNITDVLSALCERLVLKRDDSYMNDLYDYRDELAEELREGTALLGALERRLDNVQAELEITNREIYGPDYAAPRAIADFDDLPAPRGVDEDEAPEGYKAVAADVGCTGCAFDPVGTCPASACHANNRGDWQEVVFVRR